MTRSCPSCGTPHAADARFCSVCGTQLAPVDEREERRLVTILFADLAGSTGFGERVDPEDVRDFLGSFAQLVGEEVAHYGGTLEKFIGDAAMAVFGIPQSHEDDAERAVHAALAIRDRFPELAAVVRARHGVELGIRVGVNTGEVVAGPSAAARGDVVVSGDAVNVAARLEQHAKPGTVLVGDRTRTAAERAIEFRAKPAIAAKGKEAPVAAWEAIHARPEPRGRGVEGLDAPLVGREQELTLLATLAARVERERLPQLVTLFGSAGVGKSRLLQEFVARVPQARLLGGRCVPYGDGITYRPLADIAKDHAGILETDSAADAFAKLDRAVASVVPDANRIVEALATAMGLEVAEPEGDRRAWLHDAWARYLASLGRERLTIVAIEDIHWASEALLDAIDHFAETLSDTAVLLVFPARPELLEGRTTWGAGRQNATAFTIPPLQEAEATELVEALLGADLPAELRASVLERAEGNPFFVEEILRMLIERGALRRRNSGWDVDGRLADLDIPDSVHGVISARLDLLDGDARETLRRCAVVGRVFWPEAVGVDGDRISVLVRRGLVREQPTSSVAGSREFGFKHALTQEVAYSTLPRSERCSLHRGVADWILAVAPDRVSETAELAAYHLTQAIAYGADSPENRLRACELLLQAGETALRSGSAESSDRLFVQALELGVDERKAYALSGRGRALLAASRLREAEAALEEARALAEAAGDDALLGEVLSWSSRTNWLLGKWPEALGTAEAAVDVLGKFGESREYARALARRSQIAMLRDTDDAIDLALEALEVARRVGDRFAEVNARINLYTARSNEGVAVDIDEMRACVALGVEIGASDEAYRAFVNWIWQAHAHAPLPYVLGEAGRALDALRNVPAIETFVTYVSLSIARLVELPRGNWDAVDAVLAAPAPTAASTSLVRRDLEAGMAIRRGDLARAEEPLRTLRRDALASGEPQRVAPMFGVAFARACVAGDRAEARELTDTLLDIGPRIWIPTFAPTTIARALFLTDADLLRRLHGLLLKLQPECRRWRVDVAVRITSALVALVDGDSEGAVTGLEAVIASEGALGRNYEVACLELDLARALDAAGRSDEADATRARARAYLDSLGCVNPF